MTRLVTLAAGLAALLTFGAVPAQAAVQITGYSYSPGSIYGGLTVNGQNAPGEAGQFELTIEPLPSGPAEQLLTFCIDVLTSVYTYSPYDIVSGASFFSDATRQNNLAALLGNAAAEIASAGTLADQIKVAAALQLAVWEVVYDTGSYSLASGVFSTYGDFDALGVSSLSQTYLDRVTSNTWTGNASQLQVMVSRDGASQNQIFLANTPAVPEPATWLMMIVGFFLIGSVLRRNRQSLALQTA